jgi:hypothetical protein
MIRKKYFPLLRCEKTQFATKAQRHEVEKMLRIFPLCRRAFVA